MTEVDGWLDYAALQLHDTTTAAMHASEVRLERLSGEVRRLSSELLTRQSLRLEHFTGLLPDAARDFLARQTTRLENAAELIAGRSPERHPPAGIRRGAERRQSRDLGRGGRGG